MASVAGDTHVMIDEEDASQPTIMAESNFRRVTDRHTLKLYRTIMSKSSLDQKHMDYIADFYASEKMPMGRVSQQTYASIFEARSFDRYGKMVANKLSDKERMIADLQATLTAQTEDGSPNGKKKGTEDKGSAVVELKTPIWKIGYKKAVYGPPGLAPPVSYAGQRRWSPPLWSPPLAQNLLTWRSEPLCEQTRLKANPETARRAHAPPLFTPPPSPPSSLVHTVCTCPPLLTTCVRVCSCPTY